MSIGNNVRVLLLLVFSIAIGTASCDMDYDKDKSPLNSKNLLIGGGCLMNSPIVMTMTTYDMDDQVIATAEQTIANMTVSSTQPNMLNMYEMYAGVELQVDLLSIILHLDDPMPYVNQNPLLTQFWALKSMRSSVAAGADGEWMTADDTIDPIYGYFETISADGKYMQIQYSDFGVTPKARIDFQVTNNLKVKTWEYSAGGDGDFGTEDDVLTRTTVYQYNDSGKMLRAVNYSDDETTFQSSYVFTYDDQGRLSTMTSYEDEAETTRLLWGSYSTLTWDNSGEHTTLTINLGLRMQGLFGPFNQKLIKFYYEFSDNAMIHKLIQYQPMSETDVDICYIYNYSEGGLLASGKMNDSSDNYSDDGMTQVSQTKNSLEIGF
ncbi:MAG: hypothetical protein JW807_09195 [Spirochaetes bacterium]|nr:hypothetical protein [Spirochaetota bacterium]